MNYNLLLMIIAFLVIYGLCNYYVCLRGWQAFNGIAKLRKFSTCWTGTVIVVALSFPLGRWVADFTPNNLAKIIILFGSYWMAALYYLLVIFLIFDLLRFLVRRNDFRPPVWRGHSNPIILGILCLVVLLLIYGTWNANHPVITNYEITLNKKSSHLDSLRIVVVSDIHLGWIVGTNRLEKMTEQINSLNPDLILMPGDIIDEGVNPLDEESMPEVLKKLKPQYGTFAAMGNHEYISGDPEKAVKLLKNSNITMLRDQAVTIADSFYILGRDDASSHRLSSAPRMELSALISKVDKNNLPVILLDHEPFNLDVSDREGVDLQFSGHTHQGQLFPNNYITAAIFEKDWGYLRKQNLQVIVSSGFGTWGPPIRIGNHPEIVNVLVHFAPVE